MKYKAYPTSKTEKSRKNRKHMRRTVYAENKALHSSRAKKESKE